MEWAEVVAIPAEELEANAVRDLERLTRLKAQHTALLLCRAWPAIESAGDDQSHPYSG